MNDPALEVVIARYFDSLYHADAELMGEILHPAAIYATADEAAPLIRDVPTYLAALRARTSPASRGEVRADRIVSIDVVGDTTARACVTCVIGDRGFTDFLSFLRIDGTWRIIAKVFAIHEKPQEAR